MSIDQIMKALDHAGVSYRHANGVFHVPMMGFGWHSPDAVAAWLSRR